MGADTNQSEAFACRTWPRRTGHYRRGAACDCGRGRAASFGIARVAPQTMMAQSMGGLLTIVFNDALAPPQSDVGFRPTPARGRVCRDGEQIILDTRETLGSLARVIPPSIR